MVKHLTHLLLFIALVALASGRVLLLQDPNAIKEHTAGNNETGLTRNLKDEHFMFTYYLDIERTDDILVLANETQIDVQNGCGAGNRKCSCNAVQHPDARTFTTQFVMQGVGTDETLTGLWKNTPVFA